MLAFPLRWRAAGVRGGPAWTTQDLVGRSAGRGPPRRGGGPPPAVGGRPPAGLMHAVVLVEGVSDQVAVEALARRRGRDLRAEGVAVVPMGGATNIRKFLDVYGPRGAGLQLAGLCDAGEEGDFRRGPRTSGLRSGLTPG